MPNLFTAQSSNVRGPARSFTLSWWADRYTGADLFRGATQAVIAVSREIDSRSAAAETVFERKKPWQPFPVRLSGHYVLYSIFECSGGDRRGPTPNPAYRARILITKGHQTITASAKFLADFDPNGAI